MSKDLEFGNSMRARMLKGVDTLANAVKITLGPKGRNVVIQRKFGPALITKDGVTVAKEIQLQDKFEDMGAQLVKEIASRSNDIAGDGTTTATVLAQEFISEGVKLVNAGLNPMDVKRGIDKVVSQVVLNLKEISKEADDISAIRQVATISANNDEEVGDLIAQAMERVGKNGVITIEDGTGFEDALTVVEGLQFERGYLSPYFVNNPENATTEYDNPNILLIDGKLNSLREILPVLEYTQQQSRPLVVIAEDFDQEALGGLVLNSVRNIIKVCAVKAPAFGERRKEMLKDMAIVTNGRVIDQSLGITAESFGAELLGTARKVIVAKDSTTIINGAGAKEQINARIEALQAEYERTTSQYDQEKLKERIAKLAGGVAIIKVGGATEVEMKEKKDRVEDALSATRAAVEEGVVPGGGIALIRASQNLDLKGDNDDQTAGIRLAIKVMQAPLRQIAKNCGLESSVIVANILDKDVNYGFNARTESYGDMFEMGVLDPTKVTRAALQNAASIAGLMLTTECMIVDAEEEKAHGDSCGCGHHH